jgi:hypothetical protein
MIMRHEGSGGAGLAFSYESRDREMELLQGCLEREICRKKIFLRAERAWLIGRWL